MCVASLYIFAVDLHRAPSTPCTRRPRCLRGPDRGFLGETAPCCLLARPPLTLPPPRLLWCMTQRSRSTHTSHYCVYKTLQLYPAKIPKSALASCVVSSQSRLKRSFPRLYTHPATSVGRCVHGGGVKNSVKRAAASLTHGLNQPSRITTPSPLHNNNVLTLICVLNVS